MSAPTDLNSWSTLLAKYLDGPPKVSQIAFAEAVDVSQQTVSRWKSGDDIPLDLETLLLVERKTDGAVPIEAALSKEAAAVLRKRQREIATQANHAA